MNVARAQRAEVRDKLRRSGGRPAEVSKARRKLSPELMRIVIESLRERPILSHAAGKAGIHRRTLEYWMKCSKAGKKGYEHRVARHDVEISRTLPNSD